MDSMGPMQLKQLMDQQQPPSNGQMAGMSWLDLESLRRKNMGNQGYQQAVAPYEHRAYAREDVRENPMRALLYAAMIPGYQAAKAVGAIGEEGTTSPSMEQMKQGFVGVYEGLGKPGYSTLKSLLGRN